MDSALREELLEQLWHLLESGLNTVEEIAGDCQRGLKPEALDRLYAEGFLSYSDDRRTVSFTEKGERYGRRLIRAHRLGERLLYDVLGHRGERMEAGACEFEHLVAPELVDSVCVLLGHPRECPHGLPIPEGECCKRSVRVIESSARPLTELRVGDTARVAYLRCESDDQLHRLDGFQLRPGVEIKLHQTYPAYVVECEGAKIAVEEKVAENIHVWVKYGSRAYSEQEETELVQPGRKRRRWRFRRKK